MLAWPSISCTARRSCDDCSTWLAKEWRSICGCTCSPRPRRLAHRARRLPTVAGWMRRPRAPTNSAFSPGAARRAASHGADRYRTRLRALAGHRHLALAQVEPAVVDVERDQLAQAQARRVKQLEHRLISLLRRRVFIGRSEKLLCAFDRESLGQR